MEASEARLLVSKFAPIRRRHDRGRHPSFLKNKNPINLNPLWNKQFKFALIRPATRQRVSSKFLLNMTVWEPGGSASGSLETRPPWCKGILIWIKILLVTSSELKSNWKCSRGASISPRNMVEEQCKRHGSLCKWLQHANIEVRVADLTPGSKEIASFQASREHFCTRPVQFSFLCLFDVFNPFCTFCTFLHFSPPCLFDLFFWHSFFVHFLPTGLASFLPLLVWCIQ